METASNLAIGHHADQKFKNRFGRRSGGQGFRHGVSARHGERIEREMVAGARPVRSIYSSSGEETISTGMSRLGISCFPASLSGLTNRPLMPGSPAYGASANVVRSLEFARPLASVYRDLARSKGCSRSPEHSVAARKGSR